MYEKHYKTGLVLSGGGAFETRTSQRGLLQIGGIAERAFMLSMSKEFYEKSKRFDLFIAPPELVSYKILDPEKAEELFMIGYNITKEKLKENGLAKLYA